MTIVVSVSTKMVTNCDNAYYSAKSYEPNWDYIEQVREDRKMQRELTREKMGRLLHEFRSLKSFIWKPRFEIFQPFIADGGHAASLMADIVACSENATFNQRALAMCGVKGITL